MIGDDSFRVQLPNLEDVVETNPLTVTSGMFVIDVITEMNRRQNENSLGKYVVVLRGARLVGILTERELLGLTISGREPSQTRVDEVMNQDVVTLRKSELQDLKLILSILQQYQIKHLPLIGDRGNLEGIISWENISQMLYPSHLLKMRRVAEAINTDTLQAPATASILDLSRLMFARHQGCVVIVETRTSEIDGQLLSIPVGLVTEQDLVQLKLEERDLATITAETVMSTPAVYLNPEDSLVSVQQQMTQLGVSRLVIVGEQKELQGIISYLDLLRVLDPNEVYETKTILQQQLAENTNQIRQVNQQLNQEITQRRQRERVLEREKELAQVTLQSIGDAVVSTDAAGNIEIMNLMAEQLSGWKAEEVRGQPLSAVFQLVDEYTREQIPNPVERILEPSSTLGLNDFLVLIARDGTEYAIKESIAPIQDSEGHVVGTVWVFHDVTESRRLANQLSWQASHDILTGLYNRSKFEEKLIEAIASAQRESREHALCYLDLDRFKIVNDTCGHGAGDRLLQEVTQLIAQKVRTADIFARLGGDEFGLLLYGCPLSQAYNIAETIRQTVEEFRFAWENRIFTIGVSIGLVPIEPDTESVDSLMSAADTACYAAKDRGRNHVYIYRNNDREVTQQQGSRQWLSRLNQALAGNLFRLYTQEIVSISNDVSCHYYEVLVRLSDETGTLLLPNAFIPAAERYNLMPQIDRWVINTFLDRYEQYCLEQQDTALNHLYTINLSGASIVNQQFRLFLEARLSQATVPLQTICFEITETDAISKPSATAELIRMLKSIGCSIALDDFGSTMSSLTHLKNLPVDYVKIDDSFIKNIVSDRLDYTAVECFNRIGQVMNIETIAEFVENEAILEKVREIGINYVQGSAISSPQPLNFA